MKEKTMKILNFGSCNIDYVYSLDHIVREGETEQTDRMEVFAGGKGLNQSIALALAGAEVYHAGCIGTDGEMLRDLLAEKGVDLSFLKHVPEKNGHAIIQVGADGANSIFLYAGSNRCIDERFVDEVLDRFDTGDVLLLQNEISCVAYLVEKAYEKGMRVILNPSPYDESLKKIGLDRLFCLILNEVEAEELTGKVGREECLRALRASYPSLKVMLTLGSRGCIYADGEQEIYQSAFRVKAVDTTAAGDTFTGYFITELVKGTNLREVLRISCAASALAVSKKGAAPSIPAREDVLAALTRLQA